VAYVLDGKADCGWSLSSVESGTPQKALCLGAVAIVCLNRGLEMCVWWVRSHTPSRNWRAETENGFIPSVRAVSAQGFVD